MEKIYTWSFIVFAVAVALTANAIATIWAQGESKFSIWLLALLLISPVVFITFGLVTARVGLVVSAGTIDALLTISTIAFALFVFKEWSSVSIAQYVGIAFTINGIIFMHLYE